jgi:hypothetical protein
MVLPQGKRFKKRIKRQPRISQINTNFYFYKLHEFVYNKGKLV